MEGHLLTGWFVARFAVEREPALRGPQDYIAEFLDASTAGDDLQQLMAEAEVTRMAMQWGLEVEDVEDEDLADV